MGKRIWKSAVARALEHQHKTRKIPDTVSDRLIARSQKGFTAEDCAIQLAKKVSQDFLSSGRDKAPVDLGAVCSQLGLTVEYKPLALEALLKQTDQGFQVLISSTLNPTQQRLALAHEVGHLVLYQTTALTQSFGHVPLNERLNSDSMEIEELCDHFAKELAMPSEAWKDIVDNEGLSLSTLKRLSRTYSMDLAICAERIVEVSNLPCLIIAWSPVPKDAKLNSLEPVTIWSKNVIAAEFLRQKLERSNETMQPGFPFHAFDTQNESAGRIYFPMRGLRGNYLAQSVLIDSQQIFTLLLPSRLGWEKMFRVPPIKSPTNQ
jgi:IrrE N-terminal-like domain